MIEMMSGWMMRRRNRLVSRDAVALLGTVMLSHGQVLDLGRGRGLLNDQGVYRLVEKRECRRRTAGDAGIL